MNFYVNECFLSVDPGESPYKCTQCSRAFVRSTDLQRHLRNHTGEKPYKCQECSRAFARSTDLKRHMRTHTGEKPYKCWQCSKAFSQSGSLQTHLHTHYKESLQMKGVLPDKTKRTWIVKKKYGVPPQKPEIRVLTPNQRRAESFQTKVNTRQVCQIDGKKAQFYLKTKETAVSHWEQVWIAIQDKKNIRAISASLRRVNNTGFCIKKINSWVCLRKKYLQL